MSGVRGDRVRIVRSALGAAEARAVAAQVASEEWAARARVLKQAGSGVVLAGEVTIGGCGVPVVVKRAGLRGARDGVARVLGRSRLMRQWRGADRLERAGIACGACLVLALRRSEAGELHEVLVMEEVVGETLLAWVVRDWRRRAGGEAALPGSRVVDVGVYRALLSRVGGVTARMTLAAPPVFNRDHKPSNIMVVAGEDGSPRPVMIDTVGVRRWRGDVNAKMLAKLYIEALGVGCPPRAVDCWRVLRGYYGRVLEDWDAAAPHVRRVTLKRAWRALSRMVVEHGDPRPKDEV